MPQCGEDGSVVRVPSFLLGFKITSSIPCLRSGSVLPRSGPLCYPRLPGGEPGIRRGAVGACGPLPIASEAVSPYPSVSRARFTGTPASTRGLTAPWAETGRLTEGVMLRLRWPDLELVCPT